MRLARLEDRPLLLRHKASLLAVKDGPEHWHLSPSVHPCPRRRAWWVQTPSRKKVAINNSTALSPSPQTHEGRLGALWPQSKRGLSRYLTRISTVLPCPNVSVAFVIANWGELFADGVLIDAIHWICFGVVVPSFSVRQAPHRGTLIWHGDYGPPLPRHEDHAGRQQHHQGRTLNAEKAGRQEEGVVHWRSSLFWPFWPEVDYG